MAFSTDDYRAQLYANESIMLLRDNLLLAGMVHRDFEKEFALRGKTVNTRRPRYLTSKLWGGQGTPTSGLVTQSIDVELPDSDPVAVTLDKFRYTSFIVEDEPDVTSVKDLAEEYVEPSIVPIATDIDSDIITEFTTGTGIDASAVAITADTATEAGAAINSDDIVEAATKLSLQKCPEQNRKLILSTAHRGQLLKDDVFVRVDQAGSTEALRRAELGMMFGFDSYHTQLIPSVTAGPQSLAFHPNALTLAVRPLKPVRPGIGASSAFAVLNNVSMRVTIAYNNQHVGTEITSACLYGLKLLDSKLGCRIIP